MPEIVRARAAHAVVADLHHPRALLPLAGVTSTRVGSACLRALRTASASTDCASGSSSGGTATSSLPRRSSMPRSGMRARRRATSSSSVVCVSRALRPSGRCSARRRSRSAGLQLHRRRARAPRAAAARRWRRRAARRTAAGSRPRAPRARGRCAPAAGARAADWNVAWRAASASAEILPSVHSRSRSSSDSGRRGRRSARITPAPAPAGRQRRADERRVVEQVAEALGQLARDRLGVHLDHAVLDQRLARDRRRLDGHVRVARSARATSP